MGEELRLGTLALAVQEPESAKLPPVGDYALWASEQAALLRAGLFARLDVANVADEIESLGKSEFRSVVSALEQILLHMLKWQHQPERLSRSWMLSIASHRQRLADDLADSPSLRHRLGEALERAYRRARLDAARETDLRLDTFPAQCPYSWAEVTEAAHVIGEA